MRINGTTLHKRVLIVEDEFLLAMQLEDMLTDLGHEVTATVTRIDRALELAGEVGVDFAILDINVAGILSFPVADVLRRRGIPFVFASGYSVQGLTDSFRGERVLTKPYRKADLERAIAEVFPPKPTPIAEGVRPPAAG